MKGGIKAGERCRQAPALAGFYCGKGAQQGTARSIPSVSGVRRGDEVGQVLKWGQSRKKGKN